MNRLIAPLLAVSFAAAPLAAMADPHKDERGHGKHRHGREYKEEYFDGACKVERKWKKNGEFKEERKCHGSPAPHVQYVPVPVPVYEPPVQVIHPPVFGEPGVVIHGTVRVR